MMILTPVLVGAKRNINQIIHPVIAACLSIVLTHQTRCEYIVVHPFSFGLGTIFFSATFGFTT
jgi:hypothetical protein